MKYPLFLLASLIGICIPSTPIVAMEFAPPRYETAVVQSIQMVTVTDTEKSEQRPEFQLRFIDPDEQPNTITLTMDPVQNPYQLRPTISDRVMIQIQPGTTEIPTQYFLDGFDRSRPLWAITGLFILTLVLLSGWQGLKTAGSIGISIGLIGFVLIPAFLQGLNPIPIAIVLTTIFSAVSSGISMGWNRKTLATTVGTLGGTCLAWLIGSLFADWAHLNGLASEEDRLFFQKNPLLNPDSLFFAGLIIAAMGVIEDVAVSIASGVFEVQKADPKQKTASLMAAGLSIGRDHLSALTNTLIFAYVGASLSTLLLFQQSGNSWSKFFSFEDISTEIIRALSATIGLILTVPLTAWLAAKLAERAPTDQ